jgi:DNA-binding MarR family transcriptional regulator
MTNHSMTKQVGLLLAAVRRRQRQAVEARVACLGLSSQQFWVLDALHHKGECSLGEVLAGLPMDQPTASRVLAALDERELVRVENDPSDRRRRCLRLTGRGARLAQHCATIADEIRKAIVGGFSHKELSALHSYLDRFVANLDHFDAVSPPVAFAGGKGLAKTRAENPRQ